MSKINLRKAKLGDKFRTRIGEVLTYKGTDGHIAKTRKDYHICARPNDYELTYFDNGKFIFYEEHPYDLVEQVLDKPLDELIEEGTKQIKKNDDAIKEEQELQRRQEVVELAEKMYIMFEKENLRCCLSCNESTYYSEDLQRMAFVGASSFVNNKHKYLKDGKL